MSNNNPLYLVRIASQIKNTTLDCFSVDHFLADRLDIKYISTLEAQSILSITFTEVAEEAKPFMSDNLYFIDESTLLFDRYYDIYDENGQGLERKDIERRFLENQSFNVFMKVENPPKRLSMFD